MSYPGNPGTPPSVAKSGGSMPEGLMASGFMSMLGSGLGQGIGSSLPGMMGGAGGPAISSANGNRIEPVFDQSGWNVNFGSGTIKSDRQQLPALGGAMGDMTSVLLWVGGGLLVWKILSKKKHS